VSDLISAFHAGVSDFLSKKSMSEREPAIADARASEMIQ
jgi:hypothetical protein